MAMWFAAFLPIAYIWQEKIWKNWVAHLRELRGQDKVTSKSQDKSKYGELQPDQVTWDKSLWNYKSDFDGKIYNMQG